MNKLDFNWHVIKKHALFLYFEFFGNMHTRNLNVVHANKREGQQFGGIERKVKERRRM